MTERQKLDVEIVLRDIVPNELVDFVEPTIDPKKLLTDYIQQHRPVVIKAGSIEHWPATEKWANITSMMELYSNISVRISELPTPDGAFGRDGVPSTFGHIFNEVDLASFHKEVFATEKEYPDVRTIFHTFEKEHPMAIDMERPKVFDEILHEGFTNSSHRCSSTETNKSRDAWEFFMGPALSGAQIHSHCAAFNALIAGVKVWYLWPPHLPAYRGSGRSAKGHTPPYAWIHDDLDEIRTTKWAPIEFVQYAGEVVYVPDQWHHMVVNIAPVIGTSAQLGRALDPKEDEEALAELRRKFSEPVDLDRVWPAGVMSESLLSWEPGSLGGQSKNYGVLKQ